MDSLVINMISIVFAIKILLFMIVLAVSGVSYFHTRETIRMESRLGIAIPLAVKTLMRSHILIGVSLLLFLTFLFFI